MVDINKRVEQLESFIPNIRVAYVGNFALVFAIMEYQS